MNRLKDLPRVLRLWWRRDVYSMSGVRHNHRETVLNIQIRNIRDEIRKLNESISNQ